MSSDPASSSDPQHQIDKKIVHSESEPLLSQPGPSSSSAPHPERPRTVRHHRRTLSGRSIRSGHFQFGPSYHPNIYPAVNDPFTRQAKRAADRRARSRFFKALLTGIGLWIVFGLVLGWTGLQQSGWGKGNHRLDYGAKPSVPPSDGLPVNCAKFKTTNSGFSSHMPGQTTHAFAKLGFPLENQGRFFVHGRGSFAKGRITIGIAEGDQVEVAVEAVYNDEALIDLMTVCHVDGQPPARTYSDTPVAGIGIYTPSPEVGPYPDSDLEFRLTINLPRTLQNLESLEVRGDLFAIALGDLSTLALKSLDVETTVASIAIDVARADRASVRTNNGQIEGAFNITKGLSLASTNGAISADVALLSPEHESFRNETTVPVPVDVTTINGAVTVKYTVQPSNVRLASYVASTNGRAQVQHPSSYEGTFEVETTWGSAAVKGPGSKTDPTGKHRERQISIDSDRDELGYRHISGTVWWGNKDEKEEKIKLGKSMVKTTLGSARVVLD